MGSRAAGLLVHLTSLPADDPARRGSALCGFLDWAAEAGLSLWQTLPVNPTGGSGSPYSALSAHAGDARLLPFASAPASEKALRAQWKRLRTSGGEAAARGLAAFVEDPLQASWLEDWALYATLRRHFAGRAWTEWGPDLRDRRPRALQAAQRELADEIGFERYVQFRFFEAWGKLRREAHLRGIRILGDLPFYVGHDSADVWANRRLFDLDARGVPRKVAGVPPDYFSETGQLWGHPIYRWDRLAEDGFGWWIERCRTQLRLFDALRLDHFRAFESYWEIDGGASATRGRWAPGPGRPLFDALRRELGQLPFFAEDLGEITDEVRALRRALGLRGTRVVQFGFGSESAEHDPDRAPRDCVIYTGTHDNDTARGWFDSLDARQRAEVLRKLGADERTVPRRMIEAAYRSDADWAIVPLQDVFELGSEARMNRPGVAEGNWVWRAEPSGFTLHRAARLRTLASRAGRLPSGR